MKQQLRTGFSALGLSPDDKAIQLLELYAQRLLEKNQRMNLTTILEPLAIAELHFLDCAALLAFRDLKGKSLIDVGTGAGFPGVVLKILEPSLQLTLLDSLGKRLSWLEELCGELGLKDIQFINGRAEEVAHDPAIREQFDFATARAVAPLSQLCELCLPFVAPGGEFLAMKAAEAETELTAALPMLARLGGGEPKLERYALPLTGVSRSLILVPKAEETPAKYPRAWSKIKRG